MARSARSAPTQTRPATRRIAVRTSRPGSSPTAGRGSKRRGVPNSPCALPTSNREMRRMSSRAFLSVLLLIPGFAFAQKREIVELQRDVATMQDQVRTLQRSIDEKMSALTVLVQQSLESSNNANKAVAVLEAR